MTKEQRIEKAFEAMAKVLDRREAVYEALQDVEKLGFGIPAQYENDAALMLQYESWKVTGSWRNNEAIVKKVRKAAKKSVDNIKRSL